MILGYSSLIFVALVVGIIMPSMQKVSDEIYSKPEKKNNNPGWLESASYITDKYK